jgi:hypothetical protein
MDIVEIRKLEYDQPNKFRESLTLKSEKPDMLKNCAGFNCSKILIKSH